MTFLVKVLFLTGVSVVTSFTFPDGGNGECAFDMCSTVSQAYCLNGGTCLLDNTTCENSCICPENYSGRRCDDHSSFTETPITLNSTESRATTLAPLEDRTCVVGFVCQHGVCDTGAMAFGIFRCICSTGWAGAFCEEKVVTSQTNIPNAKTSPMTPSEETLTSVAESPCIAGFPCQNGGHCDSSTGFNVCVCKEGWSGLFCEKRTIITTTSTVDGTEGTVTSLTKRPCISGFPCQNGGHCDSSTGFNMCVCEEGWDGLFCEMQVITTTASTIDGTDNQVKSHNVCVEAPVKRPIAERTCVSNMICEYGKCEKRYDEESRGFILDCVCDPGARGVLCQHTCCLDCGLHGDCDNYSNGTEFCDCHFRYTGDECDIYVPEPVKIETREVTWYLWVVGVCAGALFILLLLLVVVPYLMWKHRVILIMKIIHYFQSYEDDDRKEWDAFISYKSHEIDENFVVHTLYPKLEKDLGFKLCLHFRDFVPGETIANNIIHAVENSRRTIILLSPRYIESEFTRFEYQKAQQEMLRRKHRIIPILLEDISRVKVNMDKNLKGIIETVTYLEWPGKENQKKTDKFWKRLELSLPKMKEKEKIKTDDTEETEQTTQFTTDVTTNTSDVNENHKPDVKDTQKDQTSVLFSTTITPGFKLTDEEMNRKIFQKEQYILHMNDINPTTTKHTDDKRDVAENKINRTDRNIDSYIDLLECI